MQINTEWKDYEIIATGSGEKLERWGGVYLLRPDPQIIWPSKSDLSKYPKLNARYVRSGEGGGAWETLKSFPKSWEVGWQNLKFKVMPMGFKHTGLFPEQAANWSKMIDLIKKAKEKQPAREINVLNLFAYTGGATVACASAGAAVCHVDSAKNMVERAGENADISGVNRGIRWIVDDCQKFVAREIKRGRKYDAVIMDPPSYGRGPGGELWKIEDNLFDLVKLTSGLLTENPLFYLINSYTTGLQPAVLQNILKLTLGNRAGNYTAYEVCLPTNEGIVLPCGASGLYEGEI